MGEESADDQRILEDTRSICQTLEINYNPVSIAWKHTIPDPSIYARFSRGQMWLTIPPDECILAGSQVVLPLDMRGRLEPDEWKIIIASELILKKKLRRKLFELTIIAVAIFIGISVLLLLFFPVLFPGTSRVCDRSATCSNQNVGYLAAAVVSPLLVSIGTILVAATYGRKLKYIADRKVGELLGTSAVLGVLTKIARITPPDDAQTKKNRGNLFAYFPTLQQRIKNLEHAENR